MENPAELALAVLVKDGPAILHALEARARECERFIESSGPEIPADMIQALTEEAAQARRIAKRISEARWTEFTQATRRLRGGPGPFDQEDL